MATINLTDDEVCAVRTAIEREAALFDRYVRQIEVITSSSSDVDKKFVNAYNDRIDTLQSVLDRLNRHWEH